MEKKGSMQAVVVHRYGGAEAMQLTEVALPCPRRGEVLIRVSAVSLNASDKEFLTGHPGYVRLFAPFRPRIKVPGSDIAGTVETVGAQVSGITPGDRVAVDLLMKGGGLAEYVCAPAAKLHRIPDGISDETAVLLLQSGDVAWQGLFNGGLLKQGMKVLINGAGGGSGTLAVQLAKWAGAEVTAVDNGFKQAYLQSLGADRVIDYTAEDYTLRNERYDLILELMAVKPLLRTRRALAPGGRLVVVGGLLRNILKTVLFGPLLSLGGSRRALMQGIRTGGSTVEIFQAYLERRVAPVAGVRMPLQEAAAAMQLLLENRIHGKAVIICSRSD